MEKKNLARVISEKKKFKTSKQFLFGPTGKVETKLYLLPIGPDIIVYLFGCLIVFKFRSQKFLLLPGTEIEFL